MIHCNKQTRFAVFKSRFPTALLGYCQFEKTVAGGRNRAKTCDNAPFVALPSLLRGALTHI